MRKSAEDVLAERERQIREEGFCELHDGEHYFGSLSQAAACYAVNKHENIDLNVHIHREGGCYDAWPWVRKWDKREKHDRRRSLVIASALLLAEIDRLDAEESPNETRD